MDWQPSGVGPNKHMIQTLCDEALTQGLIARALDAQRVFAEFEAVYEAEEGHHQ
jgi:hypothetical protein